MLDAVDRRRRRIDAGRRQQFVGGLAGWPSETRSRGRARAVHDRAVDEVVVAEQRAGFVHPPFADQPADPRAADDEVLVADGVDLLGAEPVARAERRAARVNVPARSCPNRKLAPTHTSTTCSHSTSTVRTNVSGSHCDISRVKRTTATPCMPARPSASIRCSVVISSGRRLVGTDDARRMGIEGHRRRACRRARRRGGARGR